MEKQITFKLIGPNGNWIVGPDLRDLCQAVFGCNRDRSITAEQAKELYPEIEDELEDGQEIEYRIVIEKRYTQKDLDEMPDSDGDVH